LLFAVEQRDQPFGSILHLPIALAAWHHFVPIHQKLFCALVCIRSMHLHQAAASKHPLSRFVAEQDARTASLPDKLVRSHFLGLRWYCSAQPSCCWCSNFAAMAQAQNSNTRILIKFQVFRTRLCDRSTLSRCVRPQLTQVLLPGTVLRGAFRSGGRPGSGLFKFLLHADVKFVLD
jgi:hypothetical protein